MGVAENIHERGKRKIRETKERAGVGGEGRGKVFMCLDTPHTGCKTARRRGWGQQEEEKEEGGQTQI